MKSLHTLFDHKHAFEKRNSARRYGGIEEPLEEVVVVVVIVWFFLPPLTGTCGLVFAEVSEPVVLLL